MTLTVWKDDGILMNTLPSLLDENFDLLEVSQNFDLPVEDIHKYLEQW